MRKVAVALLAFGSIFVVLALPGPDGDWFSGLGNAVLRLVLLLLILTGVLVSIIVYYVKHRNREIATGLELRSSSQRKKDDGN